MRGQEIMGENRDETGLVRAALWCQGFAPLYEGWDGIVEGRGEGDDDRKGIEVVVEVNGSVADVVVDGECDVGTKMIGGCTVSRCRRGLICTRPLKAHSFHRTLCQIDT